MNNDDAILLCFLLAISGIIGWAIGQNYKSGPLGFVLGAFFGPLGVAAVFIYCLSKSRRERLEIEAYALAIRSRPQPPPDAPPVDQKLRIRRGAEILGQWPLYMIRDYLEKGELVWSDEFFDRPSNSWIQLAGHTDLE